MILTGRLGVGTVSGTNNATDATGATDATSSTAGGSAFVSLVLWTPVVIDQIRNTPGNLSMLNTYFRNPPEEPV